MSSNIAIIIGRWQILQKGHQALLRAALAAAPRVIIVIGSAWRARDAHNPFTWEERQQMFESVLTPEERERVSFLPVRDYFDDERWNDAVRFGVAQIAKPGDSITLVGFKKDHTSAYLDQFPGWRFLAVEADSDISATDLRRIYFEASNMQAALTVISNYVSRGVRDYLASWAHLPAYRTCAAEHRAVVEYRKKWTDDFYFTADAVVTTNEKVLLIKRAGEIGKGLWALPGGFVEQQERSYSAALRELAEETSLNLLPSRMKAALRGQALFDHAGRSPRGRIITQAYHFELGDAHEPEVRARSDAKEVWWCPKADLPRIESLLFEDHACILDHFVGLFPPPA